MELVTFSNDSNEKIPVKKVEKVDAYKEDEKNEELISMKEYICEVAWNTTGNLLNSDSNLLSIGIDPFSSLLFKNVLSRSLGGTKMHPLELYDANSTVYSLSHTLYERAKTEKPYILDQLRIGPDEDGKTFNGSTRRKLIGDLLSHNLLFLHGVRGLVMITIMINTFFMDLATYGERNRAGVYLFLILLGVVTEFQNVNNELSNRKLSYEWNGVVFLRSKFFTLFPIYWFVLFLCTPRLVIYASQYHIPMGEMTYSVILNIFGLQSWANEINKYDLYLGVTITSLIWGIFLIYTFFRSIFLSSISTYWKCLFSLPYFVLVIGLGLLNAYHDLHPIIGFVYFFFGLLTAHLLFWCKPILEKVFKAPQESNYQCSNDKSFFVHIYGINIYHKSKDRFYHFQWQGFSSPVTSSKYLSGKATSSRRQQSSKSNQAATTKELDIEKSVEDQALLLHSTTTSQQPVFSNEADQSTNDDVTPLIQFTHRKPSYILPLLTDGCGVLLLFLLFAKSSALNSIGFGDQFLHFCGLPAIFILFLFLALIQSMFCDVERSLLTTILSKGHLFTILGESSYPLYLLSKIIVSFWFELFIEGLNEHQYPYTRQFIFYFLQQNYHEESNNNTLLLNYWYIKLIGIFIVIVFAVFVQRILYDDVIVGFLQYQLIEYSNTKRCSESLTKVNLLHKTDSL